MRELAEQAGIPSWTIDRAMLELERYDDQLADRTVVNPHAQFGTRNQACIA